MRVVTLLKLLKIPKEVYITDLLWLVGCPKFLSHTCFGSGNIFATTKELFAHAEKGVVQNWAYPKTET